MVVTTMGFDYSRSFEIMQQAHTTLLIVIR